MTLLPPIEPLTSAGRRADAEALAEKRRRLADLLARAAGGDGSNPGSPADRLRVLIAAENASRSMGGEAIIPFHYFRVLRARGIDACLITHERCREELEHLFPADRARLYFVPDHPMQKLLFRIGKLLPHMVAQNTTGLLNHWITQAMQRPVLRSLATPSTVIHQPTPVAPRFPSLIFNCNAPVVMGPLNGGMEYPSAFRTQAGILSRTVMAVGRPLSQFANRLIPGRLKAALVLTSNPRTADALPEGLEGEIASLPENGVDLEQWNAVASPDPAAEPRFVFIGRLIDWKSVDVALEALAQTTSANLDIIGDGPMRSAWQHFAEVVGVADRVRFHGWLPQAEIAGLLARSRGLLLPSIYECGGAVVLEAMAMRRAVIATAWGGPADYIDPSCGILAEPTSRESLVKGFAAAISRLAANPASAAEFGEAGRRKVLAHYDWERKVDAVLALYRKTLQPHLP